MALSGTTTPRKIRPGSDSFPQNLSITETSASDGLMSYREPLIEGVLLFCRNAVDIFYCPR